MSKDGKSARKGRESSGVARKVVMLVFLAAWAFVAASLVGFDPKDPPTHVVSPANDPVVNWCGPFGATVAYSTVRLLGHGGYALVILTGLGLLSAAVGQAVRHPIVRVLG